MDSWLLKTERIPLSKLVNNTGQIKGVPKNPRFIKDEKFKDLLESLIRDPEFLEFKELFVYPSGSQFVVVGGNMRLRGARELKYKDVPCKVFKPATPPEKLRAIAILDNTNYGEFEMDDLANEWEEKELDDWGVKKGFKRAEEDDPDEDEIKFESLLTDKLYPSNNPYEIPTLQIEKQAGILELPFAPWGADSRLRKDVMTYHFYVDDYRFENIFKDPVKVLTSGVKAVVEPNLSLFDTTPVAYGLHFIYKKRWLARYFQECGILVYADLNVSKKFYEFNAMGIPEGYNAFATRGYHDRVQYLELEIAIARKISGLQSPNLIVYGGGQNIKDVCAKYNLVYVEQFMNNRG